MLSYFRIILHARKRTAVICDDMHSGFYYQDKHAYMSVMDVREKEKVTAEVLLNDLP